MASSRCRENVASHADIDRAAYLLAHIDVRLLLVMLFST